jgi:hypothetical protein
MQEYLKELSPNLKFIKVVTYKDRILVYCESENETDRKIHSRVERVIKDINYGQYKVELHILWKKYFNNDTTKKQKTVSEIFDFVSYRGRRTKRLDDFILFIQKEMSAIGCERIIRKDIADVSDSTILRLVKKT